MSPYRKIFRNRHTLLPVIHVESEEQALRNAEIACQQGCDGVFLINHGFGYDKLLEIHDVVTQAFPDWWVGVNCLDLPPHQIFGKLSQHVAGVWVDNAGIDEQTVEQRQAETIEVARRASGWNGLYFGGVAFKYQRAVTDVGQAARLAARYVDVVTTSGAGTGKAAEYQKIVAMKKALGDTPLAIASGITPDNVETYLDVADCFLVATGISDSWTELNPKLVKRLVDKIRK
ncbi:MAG: BtpA/SgcQ family protein [Chloroflexota bacterium]